MNFGIIGYGTIGKTHAQVIKSLPDARLTAIKLIMGIYESSGKNGWVTID